VTAPDPAYVDTLTTELRTHRPDIVRAAEDELQRLRAVIGTVARVINNSDYDHRTRIALAQALDLPAPEK
jgi:hypothetical protein